MSIGPASDPGMFEGQHALTDDQHQAMPTYRGYAFDTDGNPMPMRHWTLIFIIGPETFEQAVYAVNLAEAWAIAGSTIQGVTDVHPTDPRAITLTEHV